MTEISTAHIAVFLALIGLVVPILTALAMLLLTRLFGSGDKAGDKLDQLEEKVHALELAQVGQYATKTDVEAVRVEIRQRFDQLTTMLRPIFRQFSANSVMDG